jgi:hypothetical protein
MLLDISAIDNLTAVLSVKGSEEDPTLRGLYLRADSRPDPAPDVLDGAADDQHRTVSQEPNGLTRLCPLFDQLDPHHITRRMGLLQALGQSLKIQTVDSLQLSRFGERPIHGDKAHAEALTQDHQLGVDRVHLGNFLVDDS